MMKRLLQYISSIANLKNMKPRRKARLSPFSKSRAVANASADIKPVESGVPSIGSLRMADPQGASERQANAISQGHTPIGEVDKSELSASASFADMPVSASIEHQIKKSVGKGDPMPKSIQSEMNKYFGADLGKVSIHTSERAARISDQLNADACTVGTDIFFNKGQYNPHTKEGKRLLVHELAHTVQHRNQLSDTIYRQQRRSCAGEVNKNYFLQNSVNFEYTVPQGCRSLMTYTAKWEPFREPIDCCTGAETYTVNVNGAESDLPAGPHICSGGPNDVPQVGRIRTRSGRQQVSIRVNRANCEGIKLQLRINIRIS